MNEGYVIFVDGIEQDFIAWGRQVLQSPASRVSRLVVEHQAGVPLTPHKPVPGFSE